MNRKQQETAEETSGGEKVKIISSEIITPASKSDGKDQTPSNKEAVSTDNLKMVEIASKTGMQEVLENPSTDNPEIQSESPTQKYNDKQFNKMIKMPKP